MTSPQSRIPEGFSINQVVPWGRGYDEYLRYFSLGESELSGRILDCAGGPSDFTAEMNRRGHHVVAADPLYAFSQAEIARRIDETRPVVMEQAERNVAYFVWDEIGSVEALGKIRSETMNRFLADLPAGLAAGRYLPEALPNLSLPDDSYDLALCSHYLFLYSEQADLETHWSAVREMLRIAKEARFFPVISLRGQRSPHLDPIIERCREQGWKTTVEKVAYEFQRGGNEMLRVVRGN